MKDKKIYYAQSVLKTSITIMGQDINITKLDKELAGFLLVYHDEETAKKYGKYVLIRKLEE